jgi:general stress protein 26
VSEPTIDRIWDLMESVQFCMLSTWNGSELRSRPMGAFVRRQEGLIYFFTDLRAHKDEEIQRFSKINLGFADTHREKYVSVSATAEVIDDREKVRELWSIPVKIWWESPDDPNIRLIKVTPEDAEYWDAPGNLVGSVKVAFALVTGAHVDYGEHKEVSLRTHSRMSSPGKA